MRRKILLAALAALLLSVASLAALASLGDDPPVGDISVIKKGPPGSTCMCPAIWDPVICRAQDGSVQYFSNGCVAACHGFTQCARIAIAP